MTIFYSDGASLKLFPLIENPVIVILRSGAHFSKGPVTFRTSCLPCLDSRSKFQYSIKF